MNDTVTPPQEARSTDQAPPTHDSNGSFAPGNNANPTGAGGFGDNPENINAGGRPKNQDSFTYWMNFFKSMIEEEFRDWQKNNPPSKRTVAASLAFARVVGAQKDLGQFKEVADRTEGKAPQTMIHTGGFFTNKKLVIEVVNADTAKPETEASDIPSQ